RHVRADVQAGTVTAALRRLAVDRVTGLGALDLPRAAALPARAQRVRAVRERDLALDAGAVLFDLALDGLEEPPIDESRIELGHRDAVERLAVLDEPGQPKIEN